MCQTVREGKEHEKNIIITLGTEMNTNSIDTRPLTSDRHILSGIPCVSQQFQQQLKVLERGPHQGQSMSRT